MKLFANVFNCYVYSECNDGYFGPNCIEPCNVTCRSCNKTSGICDKGCKPGWRGLYCQEGMFLSVSFNTNGIFSYLYPSCKQNLRNSKFPCFHSFNFYNKMIQDLNFLQLLKFLCKYFFTQLLILFFFYTTLYFFWNISPLLKESKTFHNNGKNMLMLIFFSSKLAVQDILARTAIAVVDIVWMKQLVIT